MVGKGLVKMSVGVGVMIPGIWVGHVTKVLGMGLVARQVRTWVSH